MRRNYLRQQMNWTGRHVGIAASVNFPEDLVTQPEKSAVSGPRPLIFARLYFFIQAARRSEEAI